MGVPTGIFEDIALDDRWRDGVIIAHADAGAKNLVLRRDFFQFRQRFKFTARGGKIQLLAKADFFGNGCVNQVVEAFKTDLCEHFGRIAFARADVAADKFIRMTGRIFNQRHPVKLRFAPAKSELDLKI